MHLTVTAEETLHQTFSFKANTRSQSFNVFYTVSFFSTSASLLSHYLYICLSSQSLTQPTTPPALPLYSVCISHASLSVHVHTLPIKLQSSLIKGWTFFTHSCGWRICQFPAVPNSCLGILTRTHTCKTHSEKHQKPCYASSQHSSCSMKEERQHSKLMPTHTHKFINPSLLLLFQTRLLHLYSIYRGTIMPDLPINLTHLLFWIMLCLLMFI